VSPVLEARNLTVGYQGIPVISGLNVQVEAGEIVALLGPNGAGKTTTLMALAGELPISSGEVVMSGVSSRAPLYQRARHGLAFVTDDRSLFMGLSVLDNLKVGGVSPDAFFAIFPELQARSRIRAGQLSGGEQQMLAMGRALARRPMIMMADELSLGLAPLIVTRLLHTLRTAADTAGLGVLLVEQHVDAVMRIADRAYVMQRGRIELSGTTTELRAQLSTIENSYLEGGDYGRAG
jgi:branched-chain amino acid transport system ATP-binding protein